MNKATIQVEATPQNSQLDLDSLHEAIRQNDIEFVKQLGDIHDTEAYARVVSHQWQADIAVAKTYPVGTVFTRPATEDEKAAFSLPCGSTYQCELEAKDCLISHFYFQVDATETTKK